MMPDKGPYRRPAEAFPPGLYLQEELDERGWTAQQLADKCGVPVAEIQAVLDGGRVGAALAMRLEWGTGVGAVMWVNLSLYYRKWLKTGERT